jgi:2-keto-4-pentenoate hydratase/2-oxohepta-3-ene-1,7-dioic acid hydratase in catechol pathway
MNTINFADGSTPVAPSKIVCVGRNYLRHIEELGNTPAEEMVIFIKPNSAISSKLVVDGHSDIHYEAEISFMLNNGRLAAMGAGIDLTRRDVQTRLKKQGLPWERAKAFDGSAVFTPFVKIDGFDDDLCVRLDINGKTVQHGGIASMIYKPATILRECQQFLSFVDGDIIMTGTPEGVGPLHPGDRLDLSLMQGEQSITHTAWTVQVAQPR